MTNIYYTGSKFRDHLCYIFGTGHSDCVCQLVRILIKPLDRRLSLWQWWSYHFCVYKFMLKRRRKICIPESGCKKKKKYFRRNQSADAVGSSRWNRDWSKRDFDFLGKTIPVSPIRSGDTGQKLRTGREASQFEIELSNLQKADQMVQWLGKPAAVPEVPGSNPG